MVEGVRAHLYVALEKDEDGYPPYETEEIEGVAVSDSTFRVSGIPVFVYGLARGDIVEVQRVSGDERLWVTRVAQTGTHWTTRVLPVADVLLDRVAAEFRDLGCDAWATGFGLVAIDVPPSASEASALALLDDGKREGRWNYDLGVVPPSRL